MTNDETAVLREMIHTLTVMGNGLTDLLAGAIIAIECDSTLSQDEFDDVRMSIASWRDTATALRGAGLSA